MLFRPALYDDLQDILSILNREIREGVAHFGTEEMSSEGLLLDFRTNAERYPWWVAADDSGRVVGLAKCSPWKSRGAYSQTVEIGIYVRPESQGQGVGKALYGTFLNAVRYAGFHTVLAGIGLPNEASIRLHEAFGFRHVGTLPSVGFKQGRWHDVGYWALVFEDSKQRP